MRTIAILAALCLCLSCRTSPPPLPAANAQKSNLTPGMVKATVKEGETAQTKILETFGAPNIITMDTNGREVWTYDVQSTSHTSASTSRGGGGGVGAVAGGESSGTLLGAGAAAGAAGGRQTDTGVTSSSTFTLMITFGENGIVDSYRMMSTTF